jgi:capsular polysaccharide biosynthesis protein
MDLGEILRVMRKRWYLMAPIMGLTIALTALAYLVLPTKYESTSTVSLLTAERASIISKSGNTNPYLTFDTSLVATADFLSRSLSSKGAQLELKSLGVDEEYTVALADNAQGPFISIVVDGDNKAQVLHSTTVLTDYAGSKLEDIQKASGVKPEDMIRLTTIIPPQQPEALVKSKLQIVIAVAGAGTALAFITTFVTEGLARSRRANATPAGAAAAVVSAGPVAAAPVAPAPMAPAPVATAPVSASSAPPPKRNGTVVNGSTARPPATVEEPNKTVILKLPPSQRIAAKQPIPPHQEETQLIGSQDRVGAKVPASNNNHRGGASLSSATVYRSSATNGKSQENGEKSREGGDSGGERKPGA